MTSLQTTPFTLNALHDLYDTGHTPTAVITEVYDRIAAYTKKDPAVWITLVDKTQALEAAAALPVDRSLPLWGVPFAIKDNIDAAGIPTTAGCPDYAFTPEADAPVVARLKAAGAILIGKTNLDQFATGLVGTRSPHGAARSIYNADYISGGSSSGSAVSVAANLVTFALGTDTAGSGRVPAMFNGLVGIKPTRGLLSTQGVVPACASLDCVSIFAHSVADGTAVRHVAEGFEVTDPWSRPMTPVHLNTTAPTIAVPTSESRKFFGDDASAEAFEGAIATAKALGWSVRLVDYTPFLEAATLLYGGAPVAERYAAVGAFIDEHTDACDPTVAKIISAGKDFTAWQLFNDQQGILALRQKALASIAGCDALMLPTTPTQYTVAQLEADPVQLNANLGTYTNFVNLFDMAAVAVPIGMKSDGFPFGVTLVSHAFSDYDLGYLADRFQQETMGIETPDLPDAHQDAITLAVVGAHLTGQPLNSQLQERGAKLIQTTKTAARYKLYALANTAPPKPGLVRDPMGGAEIEVEVWSIGASGFGTFTALVPAPLAIGNVELSDGTWVKGFVCEPAGLDGAKDITAYGGWRAYLADI